MGKVVVVTSGKGGVGKTTSTAALGAALARSGQKVVVIDFDVGLRNLDLVMGAERRVVFDLINVVQGAAKLPQALIRDKRAETLFLLPASRPLVAIIPRRAAVLRGSHLGSPITIGNPLSAPARAYVDAALRLRGEAVGMRIPNDKRGILNKLFGRRAA